MEASVTLAIRSDNHDAAAKPVRSGRGAPRSIINMRTLVLERSAEKIARPPN